MFEPPRSPQEVHTQWVAYGQDKNLDGLLSLYEADAVIYDLDNDRHLVDDAARRAFLGGWLEVVERFDLKTVSVTANGSGDYALLRSTWFAEMRRPDGGTFRVEHGGAEIVRRQDDGSFKFIIDNPYAAPFSPEFFD